MATVGIRTFVIGDNLQQNQTQGGAAEWGGRKTREKRSTERPLTTDRTKHKLQMR